MSRRAAQDRRIVFVPFIDAFGGVERLVLSLSRRLHARSVAHAVVCFRDSIELASHADWPVEVEELPGRRNAIDEWARLRNHLRRSGSFSTFLAFDLKGAFYLGGSGARFVLHLTDPPSLLGTDVSKHAPSLRGAWRELLPGKGALRAWRAEAAHRAARRGVREARRVVVMTDSIAREVRERYGVDPIVVRPGVARPPAAASDMVPRSQLKPSVLLSVCRLEPQKRVDWLLRSVASAESGSALDACRIRIVGDGSMRQELERLATALGIADRTSFTGSICDAELEDEYRMATAFVMPAAQGYGLPALEALARGVPVAVHADSGVSEMLSDSPWAEIVTAHGPSELRAGIERLVTRIRADEIPADRLPIIPNQDEWSNSVIDICEWTQ
jgi:glycosyltransferase involved in cell wall biosynthesis